jgi:hypothetical protein
MSTVRVYATAVRQGREFEFQALGDFFYYGFDLIVANSGRLEK